MREGSPSNQNSGGFDEWATLGSFVKDFLPKAWKDQISADAKTITLRQLLTHTSGFSTAAGTVGANPDAVGFTDLLALLKEPAPALERTRCGARANTNWLPDGCYHNHNFALFRIIIPYMMGYAEGADIDADTSTFFLNYVNLKVLNPVAAGPVATAPPASEPTLLYTYPAGNVQGANSGDWHRRSGGAGLYLSSDQLANFLAGRYTTGVIGGTRAVEQDNLLLGWQIEDTVRHGRSWRHGGILHYPHPSPRNGDRQVNTLAFSICQDRVDPTTAPTCERGVHVGLLINSTTNGIDGYAVPKDAYNNNWVVTY